mmetsp:Transcript_20097/g.32706  ORF Transcript_20097/g.32706 Transcript_20097/m.32706 type:complete len:447 (+) Transcript_20097:381-1721(+)|eukprot:jgi/Bigna1/84785/estExt_fgenesh1_pg.C_10057
MGNTLPTGKANYVVKQRRADPERWEKALKEAKCWGEANSQISPQLPTCMFHIKIHLLGDEGVGKTSFARRVLESKFRHDEQPTVTMMSGEGEENARRNWPIVVKVMGDYSKSIEYERKNGMKIQKMSRTITFFDIRGDMRYLSGSSSSTSILTPSAESHVSPDTSIPSPPQPMIDECDAFIVMYDVTRRSTFERVLLWLNAHAARSKENWWHPEEYKKHYQQLQNGEGREGNDSHHHSRDYERSAANRQERILIVANKKDYSDRGAIIQKTVSRDLNMLPSYLQDSVIEAVGPRLVVNSREGEILARYYGCSFIEVSALTGENIDKAMSIILEKLMYTGSGQDLVNMCRKRIGTSHEFSTLRRYISELHKFEKRRSQMMSGVIEEKYRYHPGVGMAFRDAEWVKERCVGVGSEPQNSISASNRADRVAASLGPAQIIDSDDEEITI